MICKCIFPRSRALSYKWAAYVNLNEGVQFLRSSFIRKVDCSVRTQLYFECVASDNDITCDEWNTNR